MQEGTKWIPMEEAKPKECVFVLVVGGLTGNRRNIAWMTENGDFIRINSDKRMEKVTHWMPLPDLPKQEERI